MRTPVHPDHSRTSVAAEQLPRDEPSRVWIGDLREANRRGTAQRVVDDVRDALPFVRGDDGLVPAFRFAPAGLVQRQPGVVAKLHATAMWKILVEGAGPLA